MVPPGVKVCSAVGGKEQQLPAVAREASEHPGGGTQINCVKRLWETAPKSVALIVVPLVGAATFKRQGLGTGSGILGTDVSLRESFCLCFWPL